MNTGKSTGREHVRNYNKLRDQDNVDSGIPFCCNHYVVGGTNVKT